MWHFAVFDPGDRGNHELSGRRLCGDVYRSSHLGGLVMRAIFAALSGAVFGLGLTVSGMTDTAKVQGWLDLFGAWDPTLAFVLGGAILPMVVAWRVAARRNRAVLGSALPLPSEPVIDRRLLVGSMLFGIGWAMVGLCPGPAIAVLGYGGRDAVLFFGAMALGMIGYRFVPSVAKGQTA